MYLVHGRSRLGHRDLLRHHRTVGPRGATLIVDEGELSIPNAGIGSSRSRRWNVWYTAPTAIRMMLRRVRRRSSPDEVRPEPRFDSSPVSASPSNPEAVTWGIRRLFGLPFHDNWWQTETGGHHDRQLPSSRPYRPGSMGRPVPGIDRRRPRPRRPGARLIVDAEDGHRPDRRARRRW